MLLILFIIILLLCSIISILFTFNKRNRLKREIDFLENDLDALEYEIAYLKAIKNNNVPDIVEGVLLTYETNGIKLPTDIIDTLIDKRIYYNQTDIYDEIERLRVNWKYECSKKVS